MAQVQITAGSGTPVRTLTPLPNAGTDSSTNQQVVTIGGPSGDLAYDPDGTLQVSPEPSTLLLDDFSLALANNWTTGGTAPTISGGALTTSESTTASAISYMRSTLGYTLRAGSFLPVAYNIQIEATAVTNNTRWWGYGQNQTTPTATAPVLNGAVFILDSANNGALSAAIFSNGTKTTIAWTTTPTRDANFHRYSIVYRQSIIYWLIDGVTVASRSQPNLAVSTNMYAIVGAANTATAPAAHTFNVSSATVVDQAAMNKTISDGYNPAIQATVKVASTAVAATDNALVVEAVPPPAQMVTATAAAGTAVTATISAPGAGLRHYVTSVTIERYVTAALTGSATPIVTTASNHAFVTTIQADGAAAFTRTEHVRTFAPGVAATTVNTATSFTAPATTSVLWRVTVTYYVAP